MMLLSFPIGLMVVFDSNIGGDINFQYPLSGIEQLGINDIEFFSDVTIGDVFVILWSVYAIFFVIAFFGPKNGFLQSLSPILYRNEISPSSNYLVAITKWFSILIFVSAVVTFAQETFGIKTMPPSVNNDLFQFFFVTLSPIPEEIGFRSLLIGIPVFLIYSEKFSFKHFFKSLWNPANNLNFHNSNFFFIIIIITGVLFGFAHIFAGDSWSEGKFAQASISGIILGWLYIRLGLIAAIMVHWATNYFIFSYSTLISQINDISLSESFYHPFLNTMELLFLLSGIISAAMVVCSYFISKKSESYV